MVQSGLLPIFSESCTSVMASIFVNGQMLHLTRPVCDLNCFVKHRIYHQTSINCNSSASKCVERVQNQFQTCATCENSGNWRWQSKSAEAVPSIFDGKCEINAGSITIWYVLYNGTKKGAKSDWCIANKHFPISLHWPKVCVLCSVQCTLCVHLYSMYSNRIA